jgi:integrase
MRASQDANIKKSKKEENFLDLDDKITTATQGIEGENNNRIHYVTDQLKRTRLQSEENTITICDYIASLVSESNPVPQYKRTQIQLLCYLSSFFYDKQQKKQRKLFSEMTRNDIISFLYSKRKSESEDPLHRWIGTYNIRRINIMRFFKWLYHPGVLPSKARPIPDVARNIPKLKRKEISTVKPTDLWTEKDDYIFLKYCPSPRDRCYHTVSRDTSCRPSEILNLRIKDIVFKVTIDGTNKQYAQVTVNGKTGTRTLALINSIPYVKEWINTHHPQRHNPNAFFIPTLDKRYRRFGYKMSSMSLYHVYRNYRYNFFPKLLELRGKDALPEEDKQKIRELFNKPWNPYIRRHSALTQKAQILKDAAFKQHSGWSGGSQMHLKYVHYYGNESTDVLLEAHGISPVGKDGKDKDNHNLVDKKLSTPKQCPNCSETNTVDSKFCVKCKQVLTHDAFMQILEEQAKKDKRLEELEKSFQAQLETQRKQQELLELLWSHQQKQEQQKQEQQKQEHKNEQHLSKKEDSTANTPVRVEKVTVSRRNEPGIPPTPVAETFLLVDNDKHNNGDNRYDWFKNWSIEESPRGSWRHLPTTKEQEEKWHRAMVEGLKERTEQQE